MDRGLSVRVPGHFNRTSTASFLTARTSGFRPPAPHGQPSPFWKHSKPPRRKKLSSKRTGSNKELMTTATKLRLGVISALAIVGAGFIEHQSKVKGDMKTFLDGFTPERRQEE